MQFLMNAADYVAAFLVLALLLLLIAAAVMYWHDVTQKTQTIRRNFPVIGRFRYLFEHLGEFFRQYFFAMDREEMPFNRAERSWVYRAAKGKDNTIAFGSTKSLNTTGNVIFANSLFPVQNEQAAPVAEVVIGPDCKTPYRTRSLVNISAMSYGALSRPAVEALSAGAAEAGCWLNTGEGGLAPAHLSGGCDIVFQIGTAKYGVRDDDGELSDAKLAEVAAHKQVRMFEIKLSQGAKPGKGGILPGVKVTAEISAIRGIPEGQDSISPNAHRDVTSTDDLLALINRVRTVTGKPVGIKLVIGSAATLDTLLSAVHAAGLQSAPDFITIDSGDGGTGAAPQALMDNVGLPLRFVLPTVVDKLVEYDLRDRIKLIVSGKLITPSSVAWALCAGADFINTARGFMFSLGCIQALQCNRNTCPTGITTHDEDLQRGLVPEEKAKRVAHYVHNLVHEVEVIAHSCGVTEPRQLRREHANIVTDKATAQSMTLIFPNQRD